MRDGAASDKDALDARTAAQSAGDYEYDSPGTHGTADERVKFWMLGFNGSVRSCIAMNPPAADASELQRVRVDVSGRTDDRLRLSRTSVT